MRIHMIRTRRFFVETCGADNQREGRQSTVAVIGNAHVARMETFISAVLGLGVVEDEVPERRSSLGRT